MELKMYQVDAFSNKAFGGNPAAVCILDQWLDSDLLQKIAAENNLSETAFAVKTADKYHIRWFTPAVEVDLCGHATLATAHVLFNYYSKDINEVVFDSRSGLLFVKKAEDRIRLDFPKDEVVEVSPVKGSEEMFGAIPVQTFKGKTDYMFVFEDEQQVLNMKPRLDLIKALDVRGVIVTSKSCSYDFISRFFGPQCGIDEDPVTGSAHTTLTPYWSNKLDKKSLTTKQVSPRGGELWCTDMGDRIYIEGQAITFFEGKIFIN